MRLTHTPGMRLPHDRLTVRVDREWLTTTGLAFVGALTVDGVPVVAIRDGGDGNGTRLDDRDRTWPGLAAYLSASRWRGAPATVQRLLDALVDEHRAATAIADAPRGVSVIRLVDDEERTRILGAAPTPHDRASHQHLARHLTDDFHGSRWAGEWQLQRGHSWTHLARIGERPEPTSAPNHDNAAGAKEHGKSHPAAPAEHDCQAADTLAYVAAYGSPGIGQAWTCTVCGRAWSRVGGVFSPAESGAHILSPRDVE